MASSKLEISAMSLCSVSAWLCNGTSENAERRNRNGVIKMGAHKPEVPIFQLADKTERKFNDISAIWGQTIQLD